MLAGKCQIRCTGSCKRGHLLVVLIGCNCFQKSAQFSLDIARSELTFLYIYIYIYIYTYRYIYVYMYIYIYIYIYLYLYICINIHMTFQNLCQERRVPCGAYSLGKFSKVSCIPILYSTFRNEPIFQNLCQANLYL